MPRRKTTSAQQRSAAKKTQRRKTGRSPRRAASVPLPKVVAAPAIVLRMVGVNDAPSPIGSKAPNTVVYVHGIANKPPASILKCQWDAALFGTSLGDRSRMAYWVNREYYPVPLDETCEQGDLVDLGEIASPRSTMAAASVERDLDLGLDHTIKSLTTDPVRRAWLARVAAKLEAGTVVSDSEMQIQGVRAKVLPVPQFLRQLITRNLTRALLRDVNDFLFVKERRDAMEQSLVDRLAVGGGPFVVVAHSQGTMIAYNVLRRLDPAQFHVPLFVTIGSPLGLREVQDVLRQWAGKRLPFPACVDKWVNVADRLDPVAFDTDISNDFEGRIENHSGIALNEDSPWHPHSATGYLRTKAVRSAVLDAVGLAFKQSIAPFAIAKDLVADLEDGHRLDRHRTLIQLVSDQPSRPQAAEDAADLAAAAKKIEGKITQLVAASGDPVEVAEVERLRHFVVARLNRFEVESLRSFYKGLRIAGIWRNARKRALIIDSTHTIQARPAHLGYGADGRDMCWAVLDTGIRADHPHFQKHGNVLAQWDCTQRGDPTKLLPDNPRFASLDGNGHGTHVAGIIAGESRLEDDRLFAGMAPRCMLYGFKVLDDEGEGDDSWIIKALDTIAALNESAGTLVVHGVNVSLGGSFDPSVFGCGHTPLCQELRRLWRQGVLVLLAAGNEGFAVLKSDEGDIQANLDLTIGDPANLDEAIAVGSIHKTNPHTFGISYFSSRGPTADGRRKPDVVAPGEKILSARHDWTRRRRGSTLEDLYVEMSGTSMATPHVSGLLASFLSLRREFIGYPDRIKALLLGSCIDLGRDPYMQGAGLPNLIKMLALN
jgi:subtilisin family serine protease